MTIVVGCAKVSKKCHKTKFRGEMARFFVERQPRRRDSARFFIGSKSPVGWDSGYSLRFLIPLSVWSLVELEVILLSFRIGESALVRVAAALKLAAECP